VSRARDLTRVVGGRPVRHRMAPYYRVSQDRYGKLKSVNDQRYDYELDRVAFPEWEHVDEYADNSISASEYATKDRPEFLRLIADLAAGNLDMIWLWEPSRLTRDMRTFTNDVRPALMEFGVRVYVHNYERLFNFGNRRHAGDFSKLILESENASVDTSDRVNRGVQSDVRSGKPHGKVPYGYVRHYDPRNGEFISQDADPETSRIVIEIFERFAAGDGRRPIATSLTNRGIPTPSQNRGAKKQAEQWYPTTISNIVKRVVYLGQRDHYGVVSPGNWPALVTHELFERCQRQLAKPENQKFARPSAAKHLLSNIMACGGCGSSVSAGLRQDKVTKMYYCSAKGCHRCPMVEADEFVLMEVANYIRRAVTETGFDLAPDLSVRITAARERAAKAREEHRELIADYKAKAISRAVVKEVEPGLLQEAKDAEAEVIRLSVPAPLHKIAEDADPGAKFRAVDLGVQRQILKELFSIVLHRPGRHFDPELHITIEYVKS